MKNTPKKDLFAAFDWRTTDDPSVEDHEYILKADPEWRIQAHPEGDYFVAYYLRVNEQDNTYHHTEFGTFTEPHLAMIKLIQQWKKTYD